MYGTFANQKLKIFFANVKEIRPMFRAVSFIFTDGARL
jgi:hypothetical protein